MKPTVLRICIVLLALGLQSFINSGCASGFTRDPAAAPAAALKPSTTNPLGDVSVELTPEVQDKLKKSFKFDQDTLRRTVELALTNNHLIDTSKKESAVALHITVTHVRVRNTFNAIMWGAMAGNDSIAGHITMKDPSGAIVDQFDVKASYALGGWGGGQDSARMDWLYEAFAKEVVNAITGVPKKA